MQSLFYLQLYFSYYLHIVVVIAPYTGDRVLKRVLKLSMYRLQTFLLKYNYVKTKAYVESLNICSQMCARDPCKENKRSYTELDSRKRDTAF